MALTHTSATKQAATNAVVDRIDAASPTPGVIIFETAANAEVATLTFSDPAFGAADSSGVATANSITSDTNATGGIIDHGVVKSGAGVEIWRGTAAVGSGDFNFNKVDITAGDTVEITNFTYTALPQ